MKTNRIFFDIKYRADIEAGRYKVETRDGRSARILAWDIPGDYPIAVAYGTDGEPNSWYVERFTENGMSMEEYYGDLFLVPVEQELTEFERVVKGMIDTASKGYLATFDVTKLSAFLMRLARKEIEKEQPTKEENLAMLRLEYEKGVADEKAKLSEYPTIRG